MLSLHSNVTDAAVNRGLDCPLTEVSHLYVAGGAVWHNSVTSTTTDKTGTLATFGTGSSGKAGTFVEFHVNSAKSIVAFSAYPSEAELILRANVCGKVKIALSSAEAALLKRMAKMPPNVDLVVMQEED